MVDMGSQTMPWVHVCAVHPVCAVMFYRREYLLSQKYNEFETRVL